MAKKKNLNKMLRNINVVVSTEEEKKQLNDILKLLDTQGLTLCKKDDLIIPANEEN